MPGPHIARVAEICTSLGNAATDAVGFVPVRNLLERFQAELIVRPLLVEGMIAEFKGDGARPGGARWAVLVDSESHNIQDVELAVAEEARERPLPTRMRYTVAHELAHSIAFRPTDFGIRLTTGAAIGKTRDAFVREIESEADWLTPFLLLPTKSLKFWLRDIGGPITGDALARFRLDTGVSRQTLINRLKTFKEAPPSNLAIGVGEWGRNGTPLFRKWPLFANFERGVVPAFLIRLQAGQDRAVAEDLFNDLQTPFLGDERESLTFTTRAGTFANPQAEEMAVSINFENGTRRQGAEFIYTVHGTLSKPNIPARSPASSSLDSLLKQLAKRA